ncbi:MAG: GlsB/YeaQ/YmgE family stress response membrane protein [Pseudomonadota bacterium]
MGALIGMIIIGLIAGWLAGLIVKGGGFGLLGNMVLGVIGAVVAGFVLPAVGVNLGEGAGGQILSAMIGAILVLVVIRLVKSA